MATKSILKTIYIEELGSATDFVQALENAKGKMEKEVIFKRPPLEVSRADMRKMFDIRNNEDAEDFLHRMEAI